MGPLSNGSAFHKDQMVNNYKKSQKSNSLNQSFTAKRFSCGKYLEKLFGQLILFVGLTGQFQDFMFIFLSFFIRKYYLSLNRVHLKLGNRFIFIDYQSSVFIEFSLQVTFMLRNSVDSLIRMKSQLQIAQINTRCVWNQKRKSNRHQSQDTFIRVHIPIFKSNSKQILKSAFDISENLNVASHIRGQDWLINLCPSVNVSGFALFISHKHVGVCVSKEHPLRLKDLIVFFNDIFWRSNILWKDMHVTAVCPDQNIGVPFIMLQSLSHDKKFCHNNGIVILECKLGVGFVWEGRIAHKLISQLLGIRVIPQILICLNLFFDKDSVMLFSSLPDKIFQVFSSKDNDIRI